MKCRATMLAIPAAFVVCLLFPGCGGAASEFDSPSWNGSVWDGGARFPYGIAWVRLKGRPFVAVFNQGGLGPGRSTSTGFEGSLILQEDWSAGTGGRRPVEWSVDWSCTTQDGKVGEFVIAGKKYDLANGNGFLVSGTSKPATVEQITVDLSTLPNPPVTSDAEFEAVRLVDPRVTEFLTPAPLKAKAPGD